MNPVRPPSRVPASRSGAGDAVKRSRGRRRRASLATAPMRVGLRGDVRGKFRGRFRGGFSLVEMVVSLAVVSVLLAGMTSAVVLASRALPSHDGPAAATVDTAAALHQLRDDLRGATELLNRSATSVTLHLPDRGGDGRPEVITYAWGGNVGDPLTRRVNRGEATDLLTGLADFGLTYDTRDRETVYPGAIVTSQEVELSGFDPGNSTDYVQIDGGNRIGFRFTPAVPGSASTYRVSRVLMRTAVSGADSGQATFELTGWDTGVGPDSNILESVNVPETDLDQGMAWTQIDFETGGPFNVGQTAAVSLQDTGSDAAGNVLWNANGSPVNAHTSTDGGTVWETGSGAVDHFVYGTYKTIGDDWTFTRARVAAVDVQLVHADAIPTSHRLNISLLNEPAAIQKVWEADFNADPTTADADHNGLAEWQYDGSFDNAALNAGRWSVTGTLYLNPSELALDTPFTLDLWLADTTDNALGGGVTIALDRVSGDAASLRARVNLEAGGQVVTVESVNAAGQTVTWLSQTVGVGQRVHLRLTVDPDRDTVGVELNRVVIGSFGYQKLAASSVKSLQTFTDGSNSGVTLEHLRLTPGGTAALTPGAYSNVP